MFGARQNGGHRKVPWFSGRADVAQLVEHHLAKVRVAGSNPVIRSEAHSLIDSSRASGESTSQGGLAERRGSGLQSRIHGFESRTHLAARAIGAAVARFPDTEEVTGSIPVSPTSITKPSTGTRSGASSFPAAGAGRRRARPGDPVRAPSGRSVAGHTPAIGPARPRSSNVPQAPEGRGEPRIVRPRGCGSVGRASPCQGEGRGFESRHPLRALCLLLTGRETQ